MPLSLSMIMLPTMSAGIRSGVNWMREYFRCSTRESVRSSVVLPKPGTPSSSTWPPASRQIKHAVDDVLLSYDDLSDFVRERA